MIKRRKPCIRRRRFTPKFRPGAALKMIPLWVATVLVVVASPAATAPPVPTAPPADDAASRDIPVVDEASDKMLWAARHLEPEELLLSSSHRDTAWMDLQPAARLDLRLDEESPSGMVPGSSRGRYALPMLLSAVLPGAGEISMGHWWNGLPLIAADVATWIGYAHFQSEGDSWKDSYQRFADAHWDEGRWQTNLEGAFLQGGNPWANYWDPASPDSCNCSPPYIPKDEDAREYYENLGKYNHFYPGWDDWNLTYDPEDPNTHRRQYVDMRIESNDNYDHAHTLLGVAAATRIVSVIQSYLLVRRDVQRESLQLQPMTFRGFGSGLRLTWNF